MLREYGFESEVQARAAAEEFVNFCRGRMWAFSDVGTTAAGEPLYAFTHRTFMEYFTAAHLAFTSDTPEDLARRIAPHVAADEWEVVAELAVQIKDRTTRLGADRVYRALLDQLDGSRRRRSNTLRFLGKGLRSVAPAPMTARVLTEEILARLTTGDMKDHLVYQPLMSLVDNCITCPDIVNEVIRRKTAELVASTDPAVRLDGLRLAVFLTRAARGPSRGLMAFWLARKAENVQTYADEIIAAAAAHDGATDPPYVSAEPWDSYLDMQPRHLLGPFSELYPYIARRLGTGPGNDLPELPVPEDFRRLFRDWANGKVDFAGPPPDGQESSGGVAV